MLIYCGRIMCVHHSHLFVFIWSQLKDYRDHIAMQTYNFTDKISEIPLEFTHDGPMA